MFPYFRSFSSFRLNDNVCSFGENDIVCSYTMAFYDWKRLTHTEGVQPRVQTHRIIFGDGVSAKVVGKGTLNVPGLPKLIDV